jgi:hypothetical protein
LVLVALVALAVYRWCFCGVNGYRGGKSMKRAMREQLAGLMHDIWTGWLIYMFSLCHENDDGSITIPKWAVERWKRQTLTAYDALSDQEKDSDRTEADRVLRLLEQHENV